MDITCNRCKTEYDFDDALVSDRGTTVRCTNCGDQFKVYRAGSSPIPERWIVQCRDGRELVFTDVRDLQRAITHGQVHRDDTLSRGAAGPRPLSAIAELEPLFGTAPGASLTPAQREYAAAPSSAPEHLPAQTGRTGRPPPHGPAMPPPAGLRTALSPEGGFSSPPAGSGNGMYGEVDVNTATAYVPKTNPSTGTSPYASSSSGSLRAGQFARSESHVMDESPPSADDSSPDWQDEPRFSVPSMRSRALRWVVVLVMLGMLGVAGATVGRKYLAGAMRPASGSQVNEGRVDKLLEDGERSLAEGDLETAKESFDKASALAERDARVLINLARLDAARADTDWLKLRLLSADHADVLAAAKRQAQQSSDRALRASDRAAEVMPDDPKVARVKIDALRLGGNLLGARALVVKVAAIAAQPETAYVLAALDLAEPSPSWPAVLDRLKAAAGESNLGRARAALVYALVRSGDAIGAKAELEKMSAATHPYPLLPELRALMGRGPAGAAAEPDAGKRAAPAVVPAEPRAAEPARSEGDAPPAGDYRTLIQRASQASSGGDYARAETLFRAALAKSPGDTEALAGLGDVARARGNGSLARSYYERVLAQNPHYLPALTALADLRWESGDRQGAAKLYRQLLDSAPEGPLTQRARDHIAQVEAAGGGGGGKAPKPAAPERAPSPSPAPTNAPTEIDTSDLPGFKR
ncbi:MAG TPA: tetratricopeptide repeat protein [Polyangiaceae bacterium]|nr:tetratricopeptide repeat protein [Polyangiaceae bacterium]